MNFITGSVGKSGVNKPADVRAVQMLLNKSGIGVSLKVDGVCGAKTIDAITKFQKGFISVPDGKIDVGGVSWNKLSAFNVSNSQSNLSKHINREGLKILKESESLQLNAYICPAGVLTIGYGHTGGDVYPGMKITQDKAEQLLLNDLYKFESKISKLVKVDLNENQFSALVSFAFNIGMGNFENSTLLKKLNQSDFEGAAKEFSKWNKGGGQVLPGLVTRRNREMLLFLKK